MKLLGRVFSGNILAEYIAIGDHLELARRRIRVASRVCGGDDGSVEMSISSIWILDALAIVGGWADVRGQV